MKGNNRMLLVLFLAGSLSVQVAAQSGKDSSRAGEMAGQTSSQISAADKKFMIKAVQGGHSEVQLGALAQQKASDSNVKQFAEQMVTDHSQANLKLQSVASQKGVMLPKATTPQAQSFLKKAQNLNGSAFDKAYMDFMVRDHKKDIAEFKTEGTKAKDPDLKTWVNNTLPTLEHHGKMASEINQKIGGSQSATAGHQRPHSKDTGQPPTSSMR